MRQKHNIGSRLNEKGFASIVIALILIIVLALLTVGFAQLARREQQNTLDKQKATQASYAAESGINNAYKDILSGAINNNNASSTNCMKAGGSPTDLPAYALTANQIINANNGVSYSCLLVQLQTDNIGSDNNSPGTGKHMNFGTQDNLTSLTIYWGSSNGNNTHFPGNTGAKLPTLNSWTGNNYPPLLQFSITPTSGLEGQANPTQYLIDHTTNVYLYPASSGGNSCDTGSCAQGQILSGDCNPGASRASNLPAVANFPCSATLTGLGDKSYVIHYIDYYDTSNLYVYGTVSSGGSAKFTGEPIIDVTGKARDVLKRLRVRLFINGGADNTPNDNATLPNGAVEAQNLCKRILTAPATADFSQGSSYDTSTGAGCDLSSTSVAAPAGGGSPTGGSPVSPFHIHSPPSH